MITLSYVDLMVTALLVVVLAGISLVMQLQLARSILIAALRTTVQLLLLGMILKVLFDTVSFVWVALISLTMLMVAGREVMARQQRRFLGAWGFGLGTFSMFVSTFLITIIVLLAVINVDPWYHPQYAIPLIGMMLGNTMNGVTLGLDRLTTSAWEKRRAIEGRLLLGDDWKVAIHDIRRESVRTGLIPIINTMAVAGIVSLPGMMTGQILAGAAPVDAVKYQILIMFMIAAGTGFGVIVAVMLGARRLFDDRERLRLDRLNAVKPRHG